METEEGLLAIKITTLSSHHSLKSGGQTLQQLQQQQQQLPQPTFSNTRLLRAAFDCSSETKRLRTRFLSMVSDRMDQLVLAGTVNPYLRDSPLPPTHINLNYLLDPRSLQTDFEMAGLYDSGVGDRYVFIIP